MDMNKSIKCTVGTCQNHCDSADYCSLDCITVGTHECDPTVGSVYRLSFIQKKIADPVLLK